MCGIRHDEEGIGNDGGMSEWVYKELVLPLLSPIHDLLTFICTYPSYLHLLKSGIKTPQTN